jgi:hypothetical protein
VIDETFSQEQVFVLDSENGGQQQQSIEEADVSPFAVFCIDISGSMQTDGRLDAAKKSAVATIKYKILVLVFAAQLFFCR